MIEFLSSIPQIPLWMGLAAAIPQSRPALRVYFMIIAILTATAAAAAPFPAVRGCEAALRS